MVGAFCLTEIITFAAPEINELQVLQPIIFSKEAYSVNLGLKISFNLAAPANVTVQIKRHLAGYQQFHGPWLAEPYLVRTILLGQQGAGPHSVDWDGLDEKGQPITETRNAPPWDAKVVARVKKSEDFNLTVPVNFLQVVVKAGDQKEKVNFERRVGGIEPHRTSINFRGSAVDKEGHYIVANFETWSAYRYTADFVPEPTYVWPQPGVDMGSQPAECTMVAVNSQGRVLIGSRHGVYQYDADGHGVSWPHKADYIHGNLLGLFTTDTKQIGQPGMTNGFIGFTVDDKDNIYLVGDTPHPHIDVFSPDGTYLRALAVTLKPNASLSMLAWPGHNTLAVGAASSLLLLDGLTGAVKKNITDCPANFVQCDRAGNIYAGRDVGELYRYTPSGDPLPFNPPQRPAQPNLIQPALGSANGMLPPDHPPIPLMGLAFAADGSFYASEEEVPPAGLLHYSKDGVGLPTMLTAKWGCQTLGNVYLDDQPATMELLVTNFSEQKQLFTVNWTLTDFDGKNVSGTSVLQAEPLAVQAIPFTVNMPEMGHYQLEAKIRQGGTFIDDLHAQLARIPSRPIFADRYSPFAVVWIGQWEVMALAGAKSSRGDYLNWQAMVEPIDGIFLPEHPEVPQYSWGGPDTLRAYARKYGIFNTNMLDYGEPWLGGFGGQIYNYDRFYQYSLHCIDLFSGKGEAFFQFWNEPNFFWRYGQPGAFAREEFGLVQAHVWSLVKARDKNITSLADGDAGSIQINQDISDWGLSGYIDSVEMHYPGAAALAMNNMKDQDLPEIKAVAITKLVELRDKLFPGKQIFNTEENIPANPMTAELAATNLPRVDIPQIAVGVAKVFQFSQTGTSPTRHDVTCFLDENGEPFPTYVTYATMTRMIDGDVFAGKVDFDTLNTYGYLFARAKDFVLVANSTQGNVDVT